jgi:methyl-accepting chemotaxis protein
MNNLEKTLSALNKNLLTVVDDAVFDSALSVEASVNDFSKQMAASADKSLTGNRQITEQLTNASQRVKTSLTIRAQCLATATLIQGARFASSAERVASYRTETDTLFKSIQQLLLRLDTNSTSTLATKLASLQQTALGPKAVFALKANLLQSDQALAAAEETARGCLIAADQDVIAQAHALRDTTGIAMQQAITTATATKNTLFFLGLLVIFAALMIGLLIPRSISRPLRHIISGLDEGSAHMTTAASNMSNTSHSLVECANDQTQSLSQAHAALSAMDKMAERTATHASTTTELAQQTRAAAEGCVTSMEELHQAMNSIKTASDGVANIIRTINEIAFQTNLLALNAAVEAARAGEAGLGFAVVADEVRRLAQRCSTAAHETSSKIEDSIRRSQHGVAISSRVGQSLLDIVEKARKVNALAVEVTQDAREQSESVQNVKQATQEMARITEANTHHAETARSTSEDLHSQADALMNALTELRQLVQGGTQENTISMPTPEIPSPDSTTKHLRRSQVAKSKSTGTLRLH